MMALFRSRILVLLVALVAASCTQVEDGDAAVTGTVDEGPAYQLTGSIELAPVRGVPGSVVSITGEGLPSNTALDLQWVTADGAWALQGERQEEYHGRVHNERILDLGTVTTDAVGQLETTFEVPEGFGFAHDVLLVDGEGVVRNKALFDVEMEVSVYPTSGPIGTPITIEVHGMGWQSLENTRTIVYDNVYTGFMSAVTTDGTAKAVIPATGAPGPHLISILRGAFTFPYLNPQQSPRPDIPVFEAVFTVTEGDPVLPAPFEEQAEPAQLRGDTTDPGSDPWISTDYASGSVGTSFEVLGGGFQAGEQVELLWYRVVGNRVGGEGWDEVSIVLAESEADSDGRITVPVAVPSDVGGAHRIEAVAGGELAAQIDFEVTPAVVSVTPTSGPWGTDIVINLTGVGWTETANIYTLTYDNSYIGYACGFNSQGSVEITLSAVGAPGWHFIDLYPAIYKGKESPGQQNFRLPQLTFADDHPGENLPAFHIAFFLEG